MNIYNDIFIPKLRKNSWNHMHFKHFTWNSIASEIITFRKSERVLKKSNNQIINFLPQSDIFLVSQANFSSNFSVVFLFFLVTKENSLK